MYADANCVKHTNAYCILTLQGSITHWELWGKIKVWLKVGAAGCIYCFIGFGRLESVKGRAKSRRETETH